MKHVDVKKIQSYTTRREHEQSAIKEGDMLCVYGTLRSHVEGVHMRSRAMTPVLPYYRGLVRIPRIMMSATERSGFPYAVVTHQESHHIVAEAYEITAPVMLVLDNLMMTLDSIEGAPMFYHRTRVRDVEGQDYWLYTVHENMVSAHEYHPSGDWADIVQQRYHDSIRRTGEMK